MLDSKLVRLLLKVALLFLLSMACWSDNCCYCNRSATLTTYADGRRFCGSCLHGNVFDEARATQLQGECFNFLTAKLGPSFPALPLVMQDQPEFDKLRKKFRLGPTIQGIYANRERKVYFLTGLKPANFQGLLVHEYTHAWQQVACPRQEIALSEGFASLLQYEWQVSRGETKIAKWLLENPDPNYGESLKNLLAAEKTLGFYPLVEKVQHARKLSEVTTP